MPTWFLIGLGAFVAVAVWTLAHVNELFCVSVRGGRLLLVRGRIPPSLFAAFGEIVAREGVVRATLRGVTEGGKGRLLVRGVEAGPAQMLRNAFGMQPIQRLRTAPFAARRNLGQRLGIGWLAWWLAGGG